VIEVVDAGRGFNPTRATDLPAPDAEAGRGLHLIASVSDRFHLDTAPGKGTTVHFAKRLIFTDPPTTRPSADGGAPRRSS